MTTLYALIFFVSISGLYIFVYSKNQKTQKPDGIIPINEKCSSCNVDGCANKPKEDTL